MRFQRGEGRAVLYLFVVRFFARKAKKRTTDKIVLRVAQQLHYSCDAARNTANVRSANCSGQSQPCVVASAAHSSRPSSAATSKAPAKLATSAAGIHAFSCAKRCGVIACSIWT